MQTLNPSEACACRFVWIFWLPNRGCPPPLLEIIWQSFPKNTPKIQKYLDRKWPPPRLEEPKNSSNLVGGCFPKYQINSNGTSQMTDRPDLMMAATFSLMTSSILCSATPLSRRPPCWTTSLMIGHQVQTSRPVVSNIQVFFFISILDMHCNSHW